MTASQKNNQHKPVSRRHVFYISGFDPRGPHFYHSLFQTEAAKRVSWHGGEIEVGASQRRGRLSTVWPVKGQLDGECSNVRYEFLRWDDIMREHIQARRKQFLPMLIRTYWRYISTGALWKVLKIAYPPFIAGVYPVLFMVAQLVIGLALAGGLSWLAVSVAGLPIWVAPILFAGVGYGVWKFAVWLETKVPYIWPVHVFNFAAEKEGGRVAGLEQRIDHFAAQIADYIGTSEDDEVLIVAHSNGTSVATSVVARALAIDPDLARHKPSVAFLTLGQSIMLDSLLPNGQRLRDELETVVEDNDLTWIDITAPRDGACFAIADPLAESGLPTAVHDGMPKPKLLSVPMTDLFSMATWEKVLKRRWLRIHFQYLMAYEKATPYDYFAMVAGSQRLQDRFKDSPSKAGFDKFKLFGKGT